MKNIDCPSPLIKEIILNNILSFGPDTKPIKLINLNILIGPNGSGKSNLIEVINLLRSTPTDIRDVIRKGGGTVEWIWKGNSESIASIDAVIDNPKGRQSLRHFISFRQENQTFVLEDERIENTDPYPGEIQPFFYYLYNHGSPAIGKTNDEGERNLAKETIIRDVSILNQRRDPEHYPVLFDLSDKYEKIRIYREWAFGRKIIFRSPQPTDMRSDRLEEDFSNLALFLNRLFNFPKVKNAIIEGLHDFYEGFTDVTFQIQGGTVQIFFTEQEYSIPCSRLSDGTLRYLCLLAILCDPNPPKLICIEEPELGLHPDVIPKLADLLIDASSRTQLIITTHSDILVDAMTEFPESVLVCEKHEGQTELVHLDLPELSRWLEKYRLGELWMSGNIGGTRW